MQRRRSWQACCTAAGLRRPLPRPALTSGTDATTTVLWTRRSSVVVGSAASWRPRCNLLATTSTTSGRAPRGRAAAGHHEEVFSFTQETTTTFTSHKNGPYHRKACVGALDEAIYNYVVDVGVNETPVQRTCREETAKMKDGHLQIPPDQGAFLGWLIRAFGVQKAVEVGVFTGYSSLCIAEAMKSNGRLYACELNEEYAQIASSYWQRAGLQDKVSLELGTAVESMERLHQEHGSSFDFIFIDADKKNYGLYYELALKLLRPGGLIAIDNTLLHGKVADKSIREKHVQAVRNLNKRISTDARVNYSLLSVGDGLTLVQKKGSEAGSQRKDTDGWTKAELLGLLKQTLKRLERVTAERDGFASQLQLLATEHMRETSAEDVGKHKQYVKTGSVVTVLTKQETDPHKKGVVKIILTNSSYHPNGIKVRLEDGSVGRVIAIHPPPTAWSSLTRNTL